MSENNITHILFASRLVFEKGADILIEAIDQSFSSDFPHQIIWHICSDGPYKSQIIQREKDSPQSVIYHGILAQAELASLYREVDFLFMPSRFLETFGLTALESLACGTPVIGFAKGGLIPFIPSQYSLATDTPVESLFAILAGGDDLRLTGCNLSHYSSSYWEKALNLLFLYKSRITLLHDYSQKIGGAEYYVAQVESSLRKLGYIVSRYGYRGQTTLWRRRWMFIFSLFAFWRGISVSILLKKEKPEALWMHSVQRYIGFWGVYAAMRYAKNTGARVYLSHHDIGLMAPFPQDVTEEAQIPGDASLQSFIRGLPFYRKIIAIGKYFFIHLLRSNFPQSIEHIIFAPFLEKHIRLHFPGDKISLFPHSFDENIFFH